ncbi:uncharacterized protein BDW43DRAFT_295006 [Aspergillus alliaceus]|uniref:uncharacterized protein n=1 Tax=Petromyces alliaceus TaxID=209559 RepID=UPI0012A45C84|nr:uncharacterized protein BDW43DRAFT_295006 [Aspergillus alliaceus]KAB8227054.1 hypothetical protein BDW43DRAFT_295006 [Aspergillus alliaceus]
MSVVMHMFRLSGWIGRVEHLTHWAREENMPKIRTQSYQEPQERKGGGMTQLYSDLTASE